MNKKVLIGIVAVVAIIALIAILLPAPRSRKRRADRALWQCRYP